MKALNPATLASYRSDFHQLKIIDVRKQAARQASGLTIESSVWLDPTLWLEWKDELASQPNKLVFFCAHGQEISQAITTALSVMGSNANYLEGGFAEWQKAGLPVINIT